MSSVGGIPCVVRGHLQRGYTDNKQTFRAEIIRLGATDQIAVDQDSFAMIPADGIPDCEVEVIFTARANARTSAKGTFVNQVYEMTFVRIANKPSAKPGARA